MHTIFFVGPTLVDHMPEPLKGELWLPPAGQGDVINAFLRHNPRQIVLIDGVFRQQLAVWVKELVYVMCKGCGFIGAASMGALRAAELYRFGGVGVGRIFEAYRDGFADEAWVACEYNPDTYRITHPPSCGVEQKRADALEAIEWARLAAKYKRQPNHPLLSEDKLAPILAPVIDRILNERLLLECHDKSSNIQIISHSVREK